MNTKTAQQLRYQLQEALQALTHSDPTAISITSLVAIVKVIETMAHVLGYVIDDAAGPGPPERRPLDVPD